ncbi:MAG: hypothetical protein NTV00_14335 [Methylococcales bacterium]|nr:hypothetical protein [Methylococcales bacterium]
MKGNTVQAMANRLGIDRAVFYTLLARSWSVGVGLLTIYCISHFLSPTLQGYYYTFNSLIALQIFVELGLNFAIVQFASHEMIHLSWQSDGTIGGSELAKRRLQSLIGFGLTWFGIAALLMMGFLIPIGMVFFDRTAETGITSTEIYLPWTLLVIFTALNLIGSSVVALIEGCGQIAQVAILKLLQSILTGTVVLLSLSQGLGLYALVGNSAVLLAITLVWLAGNYRWFLIDLLKHRSKLPGMSWRHEIWPFHWRIALSWMSGYFIFNLFNPLLFATHGSKLAGQMGISLQIISTLNGTALVWINTKAPIFGQLIAKRQPKQLDALFFRALFISMIALSITLLIIGCVLWYLDTIGSVFVQRLLPLPLLGGLALVCLANHIVFAEASYLRAHKQEPFMALSIASGIVTACLALLLVPIYGAEGAVAAYASTAIVIGLFGGTAVFLRKRRQWWPETINIVP